MEILTLLMILLILVALGFVAMGALNLYSADPRAKGVQLGLFVVGLILVVVAYAEIGTAAAAFLLVLLVVAQLLYALSKRSAA
jgi:hypothetical protein